MCVHVHFYQPRLRRRTGAGTGGRRVGETILPTPSFYFARCAGGASASPRQRFAPGAPALRAGGATPRAPCMFYRVHST